MRIARFEIRLGIGSPNDLWATVLGAEIGDRYTIKKALEGDDLNQDFYLEAITMDIRPAEWKVVWELSPANAELTDFWQLGDSTNGVLGTTTKLGY